MSPLESARIAPASATHRIEDPRAELATPIPLRELRRAPWNARKTVDPASIAELRASIQLYGIQTPLIVRPIEALRDILTHPEQAAASGRAFEIVAGHRRFEAALDGGVKTGEVPCFVRELTDEEAREIGLIDNLQRVDVPAMEEAQAFGELLTRLGSIAAVAAKVGKDQAYVAKRLKLCTCTTWVADALRAGLITVDHALLLARLGADEQNAALKWCLDRNAGSKTPVDKVLEERISGRRKYEKDLAAGEVGRWSHRWEPESAQRLKEHLQSEAGEALSRAPWPLEMENLTVDVPACSVCPQNTNANAPLFGDLTIGEPTCTDGGCFKEKTRAWVRIQARMSDGTAAPLRVSWKYTSTVPRLDRESGKPLEAQTFKAGQWTEIGAGAKTKGCECGRQAVTVDWSDCNDRGYMGARSKLRKPGEILTVCVEPKCKLHPKKWAKPKQGAGPEGQGDLAVEKKAKLLRDGFDKYEPAVRETIFDAVCLKVDPLKALLILNGEDDDPAPLRKEILKMRPKLAGWELEALVAFANRFERAQNVNAYWMVHSGPERDRRELWELAKKVGVDADDLAACALPHAMPAEVYDKLYPAALRKKEKAARAAPKAAAKAAKPKASVLSGAARRRIAEAQKKRWVASKKAVKKGGSR